MRCFSVLIVCGCALAALTAQADEPFPYTGYIAGKNVYVRSGPGKNYYPTDKLQQGTKLEVWRHDPGGWYAVRPPQGSFSWVRAKYLRPTDQQGIFEVQNDRVVTRVGSKLSDVREVIQIRLDRGEEVEVVETVGTGGQAWCKIAPPAGEFRWIFGRLIERRAAKATDEAPRYRRNALLERVDAQQRLADKSTVENAVEAAQPKPAFAVRRAGGVDFANESTTDQPVTQASLQQRSDKPASSPLKSPQASTVRTGQPSLLRDELDRLELELSKMVALDASKWDFTALGQQAEALLARSRDAVSRGRLKSIVGRVKRLDNIRRRYDEINSVQQETDRRNVPLDEASVVLTRAVQQRKVDHRFDASGLLIALKAPTGGQPPFALVDEQGNIVAYAAPAPGVNLRGHVGDTIGVNGLRSLLPDSEDRQVIVKHVRVLKRKAASLR